MTIEKRFWNKKYREGGISGRGSLGIYRNWKWNKIRKIIGLDFTSVTDVGCGDLRFWNHPYGTRVLKQRIFKYVGIDVSEEIIKQNQEGHKDGFKRIYPDMRFLCSPAHLEISGIRAQVIFCLDLLFHLMNDGEFELALENCCRYATQFLVIYTWCKNPFDGEVTDGKSQHYRHLSEYSHIFNRNDMEQIAEFKAPYDEFGKMYFFRRKIY